MPPETPPTQPQRRRDDDDDDEPDPERLFGEVEPMGSLWANPVVSGQSFIGLGGGMSGQQSESGDSFGSLFGGSFDSGASGTVFGFADPDGQDREPAADPFGMGEWL